MMSGKMLRCRRWGQIPSATGAVGGGTWPATAPQSQRVKGRASTTKAGRRTITRAKAKATNRMSGACGWSGMLR